MLSVGESVNSEKGSLVELMKFYSFFSSYLAARIIKINFKISQMFVLFCFFSILAFFFASISGYGYQYLGAVRTFSGGYFFKTDMAISAIILLSFISVFSRIKVLTFLSTLLCFYLVLITNARIALPLVIAVPLLAIAFRKGWIKRLNGKAMIYGLVACSAGMSALLLVSYTGNNMLGFDFSEPFSAANTQGRTVIWATILGLYAEAPVFEQMFGLGLGADSYATSLLGSHQLAGVRAHSSYVYLLVCTGVVGLLLISWFFVEVLKRVPVLLVSRNVSFYEVGSLTAIFVMNMLWFSLTTEAIIRPQLMILVFFVCGLTVQAHILEKKRINDRS